MPSFSMIPIACTALSLFVFVSHFPTYHQIFSEPTTLPPSPAPALSMLLSPIFWFSFRVCRAVFLDDFNLVLILINLFGLTCGIVYIRGSWKQHLRYWTAMKTISVPDSKRQFWLRVILVFVLWICGFGGTCIVAKSGAFVRLSLLPGVHREGQSWEAAWMALLGFSSMTCSILLYAAPTAEIINVVRLGDPTRISSFMTTVRIVCSLCWIAYGISMHDWFVVVPNSLGALFSFSLAIIKGSYWLKQGNVAVVQN